MRAFELRAALDLARLYCDSGREREARDVLAPALVGFTETPELPEIGEAQRLLASVSSECRARPFFRGRRLFFRIRRRSAYWRRAMLWLCSPIWAGCRRRYRCAGGHLLSGQTLCQGDCCLARSRASARFEQAGRRRGERIGPALSIGAHSGLKKPRHSGEIPIAQWLEDELAGVGGPALVVYEDGAVPLMLARQGLAAEVAATTTRNLLTLAQELGYVADAEAIDRQGRADRQSGIRVHAHRADQVMKQDVHPAVRRYVDGEISALRAAALLGDDATVADVVMIVKAAGLKPPRQTGERERRAGQSPARSRHGLSSDRRIAHREREARDLLVAALAGSTETPELPEIGAAQRLLASLG